MTEDGAFAGAALFTSSAQRIVDYLNSHTPLADWTVTRVTGGEQVHLHVHADQFVAVGTRTKWSDTFCHRMVGGAAPVVADTLADPDYADVEYAPFVRSYAGAPITDENGDTFGVLCGFGARPLDDVSLIDGDLVALMGSLLSGHLVAARSSDRDRHATRIAEALAQTDGLTGLVNRRGWDTLIGEAQQRIDAYGDLVAVVVIDLDGLKLVNDMLGHAAGDQILMLAAATLEAVSAGRDRVARFGGDEFTILVDGVAVDDLAQHCERYTNALDAVGVEASIGFCATNPGITSVLEAFDAADAAMYAAKHA